MALNRKGTETVTPKRTPRWVDLKEVELVAPAVEVCDTELEDGAQDSE